MVKRRSKPQGRSNIREEIDQLHKNRQHARIERDDLRKQLADESDAKQVINHDLAEARRDLDSYKIQLQKLEHVERRQDDILKIESGRLEKQFAKLVAQNKSQTAELTELQLAKQALLKENSEFRNMITKAATKGHKDIDDPTITIMYASLGQQIQSLVFKHYQPPLARINSSGTEFNPKKPLYPEIWGSRSVPELKSRMIAFVFDYLHFVFFSKPLFGLQGSNMPREIEDGLRAFELCLEEKFPGRHFLTILFFLLTLTFVTDNGQSIAEWRHATMECANSLQTSSTMVLDAAEALYNEMVRFLPPSHLADKNKDIAMRMKAICQDAFTLALLFRGGKDKYSVIMPSPDERYNSEFEVAQGSEGVEIDEEDVCLESVVVAFALCGALVKSPQHDPTRQLVLGKAHVILRRTGPEID